MAGCRGFADLRGSGFFLPGRARRQRWLTGIYPRFLTGDNMWRTGKKVNGTYCSLVCLV